MEQERIEWAPKDKEDEKFQKKMANKMQDKGPSNKEINKRLQEEEDMMMESGKKKAKNGWGKAKWPRHIFTTEHALYVKLIT